MNVLVTGATGFIGSRLCDVLARAGRQVSALSRAPGAARARIPGLLGAHPWNALAFPPPPEALDGVDAVVHLAGESVAGRWSTAKMRAIHDSRVIGTRNLVEGIKAAPQRPQILVSASAIGYYGDRGDDELDEDSAPGADFLADVCQGWEREASGAEEAGLRVVRLRIGIVLGRGGGALKQMLPPAKLGVSGPLGSGKQWWSWVHLDDVTGLIVHALGGDLRGAYNATAPDAQRQAAFARALGKVLRRPAFLPAPAFALKLVLGGFATELLSSKKVRPRRTRESGYAFKFPELDGALEDLLR